MNINLNEKEAEMISDALRASAITAENCAARVGRNDAYTAPQAFSIIKAQGCRARRYRRLAVKIETASLAPLTASDAFDLTKSLADRGAP